MRGPKPGHKNFSNRFNGKIWDELWMTFIARWEDNHEVTRENLAHAPSDFRDCDLLSSFPSMVFQVLPATAGKTDQLRNGSARI